MDNSAYHKIRKLIPKAERLKMLEVRDAAKKNPQPEPRSPEETLQMATRFGMRAGPFVLIFTVEDHHDGRYWHLSVSHSDRYPNWDELMTFRAVFFEDDMEVFQVLPRCDEYVNLHTNCFHLWHKTESRVSPIYLGVSSAG